MPSALEHGAKVVRRPATARLMGNLVKLWATACGLRDAVKCCIFLISLVGLVTAWRMTDPNLGDLIMPGILARRESPARPSTRATHPG